MEAIFHVYGFSIPYLEVKRLLQEACMYAFALTDNENAIVIAEDDIIIDSLARSCVSYFTWNFFMSIYLQEGTTFHCFVSRNKVNTDCLHVCL